MDDSQPAAALLSPSEPRSAHFWNSPKYREWILSKRTGFIGILLVVIGFLFFNQFTSDSNKTFDVSLIPKSDCIVSHLKTLEHSIIHYCYRNDTGENIFIYNHKRHRELIWNNTFVIAIRHLLKSCFENEDCGHFYDMTDNVDPPMRSFSLDFGKVYYAKKNVIKYIAVEPSPPNNLYVYYMLPDEILALYSILVF